MEAENKTDILVKRTTVRETNYQNMDVTLDFDS